MTSSPSTPKRSAEGVSFVQFTNPEVLTVKPRPGGVVVIEEAAPLATSTPKVPEEKIKKRIPDEKTDMPTLEEKTSRDFRVHSALDVVESITSVEDTLPNPLKDAMYLFSIAISTVMMMAAEYNSIPEEYKQLTELCLQSVKDDFDNHPPNIQGILNHMKSQKPGEQQKQPESSPSSGNGPATNTAIEGETRANKDEDTAEEKDEKAEGRKNKGEKEREKVNEDSEEDEDEEDGDEKTVQTTTKLSFGQ